MISARGFFEGKRITVMGLGVLGRGVGDVRYLAEQGAEVLVTDTKSEDQLTESVQKLSDIPGIEFRLGRHVESDFTDCDMVIKAAGVPLRSPFIEAAKRAGVPVYMSTALTALFAMEQGVRVIGVTGTRGKSTVTHMIYTVLSAQHPKKVFLGGNVRGVSTLQLLNEMRPDSTLVLELDSWQLQGFGDLTISPNISVFTNLMPDHLNYYSSMDEYLHDKSNIFLWQREGDVLVCGSSIREKIEGLYPPVAPTVPSAHTRQLCMPGAHNQENAALAAEALRACGLDASTIEAGLCAVPAVEGRLQSLGVFSGVTVINDNNATTPEATIAALDAFPGKHITLIAGGSDKGLPFDALVQKIKATVAHTVLLRGTGSEILAHVLPDASVADSMHDAVEYAFSVAEESGVILLSPACASFGMFKNEYDRNDQFIQEVQKYV